MLQCVAVCCSMLNVRSNAFCNLRPVCVAVYCSVFQCVAVCCSVLQCIAVYCILLQYVAPCRMCGPTLCMICALCVTRPILSRSLYHTYTFSFSFSLSMSCYLFVSLSLSFSLSLSLSFFFLSPLLPFYPPSHSFLFFSLSVSPSLPLFIPPSPSFPTSLTSTHMTPNLHA